MNITTKSSRNVEICQKITSNIGTYIWNMHSRTHVKFSSDHKLLMHFLDWNKF